MKISAIPSIQSLYIEMYNSSEQFVSSGTAFTIVTPQQQPYLLTNRHIVANQQLETGSPYIDSKSIPNYIIIYHNKKNNRGYWVQRKEYLYTDNGTPQWIEHPSLGNKADFVALKLYNIDDIHVYPYDPIDIDTGIHIGPSKPASVIGFPFGKSAGGLAIWATGFLASEQQVDYNGLPIQLIDCRSRPGQSGSPVIAYYSPNTPIPLENGSTTMHPYPRLRFIGIYSGRIHNESDLGVVWKAKAIAELIEAL